MNQVFVSIFFIFALSPNLFSWNLLGHRPAWLQDAWSEVARIGQQIQDSIREVKPLSLGSAWAPLTRVGGDYIAQMTQRHRRIQELRQKIHRLRQIDKASEASAAEEELLRLIELGDLPERHSKAGALKIGLELLDAVPGELSLPASKAKDSVPGLRLVPGAGGPPPQPNPLPADVRNDLPDPGIPWGISGRVFRNKTLINSTIALLSLKCQLLQLEYQLSHQALHKQEMGSSMCQALVRTSSASGRVSAQASQAVAPVASPGRCSAQMIQWGQSSGVHEWDRSTLGRKRILSKKPKRSNHRLDKWYTSRIPGRLSALELESKRPEKEMNFTDAHADMNQVFARTSSASGRISAQASQATAPSDASTQSILSPNIVYTEAMRSDPFRQLGDWYKGPRDAQDVAALEWESKRSEEKMSWTNACDYAADRSSEGWRLPTIWELEVLFKKRGGDLGEGCHWSSTGVFGTPSFWALSADGKVDEECNNPGDICDDYLTTDNFVLCVRSLPTSRPPASQ
ncbi:MAG: DUF1566 domain-containing protein [Myxococcaceae bacterium]|nr:DUF1566 domain-containing protein [Myxococcaceae bacterium]